MIFEKPCPTRKTGSRHWLHTLFLLVLAAMACQQAMAYSYEERQNIDFSKYTVTDPNASFFDVDARMKTLENTDNSMLLERMDHLQMTESCKSMLSKPPLDNRIRIPGYYPSPKAWREASQPMFDFSEDVSQLAGAYVATQDNYYGECLINYLNKWAEANALWKFYYSLDDRQAWYSTESMMFGAAMAYSIVRPRIEGMEEEKKNIDAWLNRLAKRHSAIQGGLKGSCCNNHFYRRALYASMIGILTDDDELFQFGVSAIYSALNDMTPEGGFPLELSRGRRATHYQNYALLYLVTNMQIISRQGYDVFNLEVNGHSIRDAVNYLMAIIEDPSQLKDYAPHEQYQGFMKYDQYFTWMEIYLTHFQQPDLEKFLEQYRPVYNRGAGGYITLYFMPPGKQQRARYEESQEKQERADIAIPERN
ncbi:MULTISPECIES: alginate lyase family protein [unclassified Modicisalibacter]|uniref:alginate lyase family protein n=1 Tax=unclassified Modicisalibacter TaxID=2679913 RepID=UPI001CCC69DB|nr:MULTISPECIES: alginate lyase family protein [unclassified Modicisalibacter]